MNTQKQTKKLKAFSLNELLVVMVIVGILAAIAIPQFSDYTAKAYRTEAEGMLNAIKNRQDAYRMGKFEFSTDLKKIGFETPPKESEGGNSVYTYEVIEADKTTFVAQAKADKDYDGDGQFEVITINQQGVITVKQED